MSYLPTVELMLLRFNGESFTHGGSYTYLRIVKLTPVPIPKVPSAHGVPLYHGGPNDLYCMIRSLPMMPVYVLV